MRALLLLLLLAPAAAAAPAQVGWDAQVTTGHDAGASILPGDDRAWVDLAAHEVWVRSSLGRPLSLTVDPAELAVEHGVFRLLNATWVQVNESRPEAVRGLVAFESRPLRDWHDGAYRPTDRWGIFLTLYPPGSPAGHDEITAFWFCWTVCERESARWARTNETEVRPFPDEITLGRSTTSESFTSQTRRFEHCPRPQEAEVCAALASADPTGEAAADLADGLAPEVAAGLLVDRARIELGAQPSLSPLPRPAAPAQPGSPPAAVRWVAADRAVAGPEAGGPVDRIPAPAEAPRVPAPAAVTPEEARILGGGIEAEPDRVLPAVVAVAAGLLALLLSVLLYHRIARGSALAQATRQRIYEAIAAEPGVRVGTLAARLGLDYTTVRHHVRLLEKLGMVQGVAGGQRRLYAAGVSPRATAEAARIVSAPSVRAVRDRLAAGAVEQARLREELGLAASTVTEAVQRLVAAGQAVTERRGGRLWVAPARFTPPAAPARGAAEGA